jgi:lysyl-tRNA synthetase class I
MAIVATKNFVSPYSLSNEDKKKLKNVIYALNDSMTRVAAERDLQKEALHGIFAELNVEKKMVRKMAKAYFLANYNTVVEEEKTFQDFYDMIIKEV